MKLYVFTGEELAFNKGVKFIAEGEWHVAWRAWLGTLLCVQVVPCDPCSNGARFGLRELTDLSGRTHSSSLAMNAVP